MTTITEIFTDRSAFSNEEECVRVAVRHAAQFNWRRAACNLLSDDAWAEFDRASTAAWDEYRKAIAPAGADRRKAIAAARAERDKTISAAGDEYCEACAAAFARLWFNDGEAA